MKERADQVPVLVAQTGMLIGARWAIEKDIVYLGRSEECDYVIDDRQVSRKHAVIKRTDKGYTIEDLESKNGTFLNGNAVTEPMLLQDGDIIQVALAVKVMFLGTDATIPLSITEAAQMGLGRQDAFVPPVDQHGSQFLFRLTVTILGCGLDIVASSVQKTVHDGLGILGADL